MSPDADDPRLVRQDITALHRSAEMLREEATLLLRRAQGQADRAASMQKRLEARLAAEAALKPPEEADALSWQDDPSQRFFQPK